MDTRDELIQVFNDSAALTGNEPAFFVALGKHEHTVRTETRDEMLAFLNERAADAVIQGRPKLADRYAKTADVLRRQFGSANGTE